MNRNSRRNQGSNGEAKTSILVMFAVIILAVVSFIVAYVLYGNRLANQSKITNVERRAEYQNTAVLNNISNSETSAVSMEIGKSVNEVEAEGKTNTADTNTENVEKRAINTSAIEKNVVEERNTKKEETTSNSNEENVKSETSENVSFINPVEGDVIKNYSSDNLVYSTTLDEWTTHLGIDYKAEKTSIVKAAAGGTVKSIKNDPRYGLTVVIEHSNGFTSMYANLLSTEFIEVGEKVEQGQTIATVGNTAMFEIADETHLHFEILKDGVNVDPNLYIK